MLLLAQKRSVRHTTHLTSGRFLGFGDFFRASFIAAVAAEANGCAQIACLTRKKFLNYLLQQYLHI